MRMPLLAGAVVLGAVLALTPAIESRPQTPPSDSLEVPFIAAGSVSMELSAGGYRISARQDNRIRLEWSVRDRDELAEVEASADVNGSDATVVLDGPGNRFRGSIEVPARTDLSIRLSAGELTVDAIAGNKDIRLNAGELRIDVGRPDDYERVDGSVWAGELHAEPFGIEKEGLFRSFDWRGEGAFRLRARLKAGELHLYSNGTSTR